MLIPLTPLVEKYHMKITGVIHVGAHWGQEFEAYRQNGITDIIFIEPCEKAYKRLQASFSKTDGVILFQCACGEQDGHVEMFVEQHNQGQSNSILKPRKHLEYYPQIQFNETERVPVRKLDNLFFARNKYNMLMMDTQGAELLVLKGATTTLRSIDYIYTEVNDQELYAGNALVTELDDFLPEFKRVESLWTGQGWGDAVYIRNTVLNSL